MRFASCSTRIIEYVHVLQFLATNQKIYPCILCNLLNASNITDRGTMTVNDREKRIGRGRKRACRLSKTNALVVRMFFMEYCVPFCGLSYLNAAVVTDDYYLIIYYHDSGK